MSSRMLLRSEGSASGANVLHGVVPFDGAVAGVMPLDGIAVAGSGLKAVRSASRV